MGTATAIAGLPFWELAFDADGDPDGPRRDAFLAEVAGRGLTDVIVLAHGWNADRRVAAALQERFFGLLVPQLPPTARRSVGLAGVRWPAQRWADEPVPAVLADGPADPAAPTLDPSTLAVLHTLFPAAAGPLDAMAALLAGAPSDETLAAFHRHLGAFSRLAGDGVADDGEGDRAGARLPAGEPRMLLDDPADLFDRYRAALAAVLGDVPGGLLHGAKEALRQATYWQLRGRAGTVGRAGLGPLLGRLSGDVRVHLVGHGFGARLVSFALVGLPAGPSPVRAVTLLEGALSQFAFAAPLPFDAARRGALAGAPARVAGPVVACFSVHDDAIGRFYPLTSFAAQEDAASAVDPSSRWGGIGANGAQGVGAVREALRPVGASYGFLPGEVHNVDASDVVRAHGDVVHPELTWVVLAAGGLTG